MNEIERFIAKNDIEILGKSLDYNYQYSNQNRESLIAVLNGEKVWRANSEALERLKAVFRKIVVDATYVIPVSSCSAGLFMILKYFITEKKKKVIIPSYSWHAVLRAVINAGGEPVFWDLDTMSIQLSKEIPVFNKDEIACCIVSHLFGIPCIDEQLIYQIRNKDVAVVVDSAQCITTPFDQKKCDVTIYSFNGSKHIPVGEGGMIITESKSINQYCDNFIMNVFESNKPSIDRYNLNSEGWNFRLSAIQASLAADLISELEHRKNCSSMFYRALCETLKKSSNFIVIDDDINNFYLGFPVIVNHKVEIIENNRLRNFLFYLFKSIGIEVSIWMNQSLVSIWQKEKEMVSTFPNSEYFAKSHLVFKEVKKFGDNEDKYYNIISQIDNILGHDSCID